VGGDSPSACATISVRSAWYQDAASDSSATHNRDFREARPTPSRMRDCHSFATVHQRAAV
jgi:hypothetical protein